MLSITDLGALQDIQRSLKEQNQRLLEIEETLKRFTTLDECKSCDLRYTKDCIQHGSTGIIHPCKHNS